MRIYVIRHGETDLNKNQVKQGWLDIPLNQAGRDLAVLTGRAMKGIRFDLCVSSPLIRAKETVEIVLRESGNGDVPIVTDDRIKEINFGREENTSSLTTTMDPEDARLFYTDPLRFPGFPGGESIRDVCRRTGEFLREAVSRYSCDNLLIGTHGCALRAMMNPLYENPEKFWQGMVPPNCAVTILDVVNGRPVIAESDKIYYEPSLVVDHYRDTVRN